MAKTKQPVNPFYVLTALFGAAFTITACAYWVLILRTNRPDLPPDAVTANHPLMNLLDRHGLMILGVEVALLAIVSVLAIMLDHFRGKRQTQIPNAHQLGEPTPEKSHESQ